MFPLQNQTHGLGELPITIGTHSDQHFLYVIFNIFSVTHLPLSHTNASSSLHNVLQRLQIKEYLLFNTQSGEGSVQEREGLVRAEDLDGQGDTHGHVPEELGEFGPCEGAHRLPIDLLWLLRLLLLDSGAVLLLVLCLLARQLACLLRPPKEKEKNSTE